MEPLELTNYFYVTLVKGKYLLALNRSQNPNTERASIHSFIVSRRKDDSLRTRNISPNPNPNPNAGVRTIRT